MPQGHRARAAQGLRAARGEGRLSRRAGAAAWLLLAAALSSYAAEDRSALPELQPGLWEFRGHDGGRKIDGKRCASPSEQWKVEIAALQKLGCKFSAIERTGSAYRFTSECDIKTRRGRQLTSTRRTVITLRGEQAFTLSVRGTTNGHPVDDLIVGRRVGDCKNEK